MLWSTIYNKIGRIPLRITQHNHVTAVIDGKEIFLELTMRPDGKPYFIKAQGKIRENHLKPGDKVRYCYRETEVIETTPDPDQYYVAYTNEWPRESKLVHVKHLTKL